MTTQELYQKAQKLPRLPGVYIMRGKDGGIIYIGKAKSLRVRVSQYFRTGVPHDHPACNLRALREAFASNASIVANGITTEDGDETASLLQARSLLAVNAQPFDFVLLGMGADGHFASLFPGAANLAEGLAMDSGIDAIATLPDPLPPEAPFARISLTLPRLLHAHAVHLVVSGEDKRHVLRLAQLQDDSGGIPYPIAALLHARDHRLQIHWSP